jgi:hypothetical protein
VRTPTDPAAMTAAVRAAVREVDPGQPVTKVRTSRPQRSGMPMVSK